MLTSLTKLLKVVASHAYTLKEKLENKPHNSSLYKLFQDYKKESYRDLTFEEFIDALAQLSCFACVLVKCLYPKETLTSNSSQNLISISVV